MRESNKRRENQVEKKEGEKRRGKKGGKAVKINSKVKIADTNTVDVNAIISIITLSVNGLNTPIKNIHCHIG